MGRLHKSGRVAPDFKSFIISYLADIFSKFPNYVLSPKHRTTSLKKLHRQPDQLGIGTWSKDDSLTQWIRRRCKLHYYYYYYCREWVQIPESYNEAAECIFWTEKCPIKINPNNKSFNGTFLINNSILWSHNYSNYTRSHMIPWCRSITIFV